MIATRLAILCILSLPVAIILAACTCVPAAPGKQDIRFQEQLKSADIVFRGKLIAHRSGMAVFKVHEEWKGNLGKQVEIEWRRGDRGDCSGFWPDDLKIGNELIVFARKGRFRVYRTNICLPTMLASDAQGMLRALGPGQIKK